MPSPSILIHKRLACRKAGFTFIEILIVMAIIGFLATFGIIAGLDTYSRYSFNSEIDNAIAMLQKARSEAINNIGEVKHGVYFDNSSPDLILFSGPTYTGSYEIKIGKNKTVSYSSTCSGNQIIFSQLAGTTTACAVTIQGFKSTVITINNEGVIDY